MKITGSYTNYLNMTSLLSPLGVNGSGSIVMQVFTSSVEKLQNKIDDQIFSQESTAALSQLYAEVSDVASKAAKLTLDDMNSVFNDRTGASSDTSVVTATAYDAFSADTGATEATYEITVNQLAVAQENTGLELTSADASVVNVGVNTFNININGQDHELSIEVLAGDTNDVVLQKIATAMNDADIGVTANVTDGDPEGTQTLTITANNTGTESAYVLTDISGNAVETTGLNNVATAAQDANYSVDGADYTSHENTISLDDGMVTVNMKGVGDAVLTIGPDEGEVKNAINAFVSELNSFMDFNQNNSDYIKEDVALTIDAFIDGHQTELAAMGITQSDDGTLQIDDEALSLSVEQNLSGVKETMGGLDGFAYQIHSYASQISTDSPLNYAKESETMTGEFTDYIYGASTEMLKDMLQVSFLDTYV